MDDHRLPGHGRTGAGPEHWPPGARGPPGRPRRDPLGEPARMGDRGLRLPRGALHRRPHLPHPPGQASRIHSPRLRRGRGAGLERGATGEGDADPRPPPRARPRHRLRRLRDRRRRPPLRPGAGARARGPRAAPGLAGVGARGGRGRPRDAHLYLRHHRRPEGRHAEPREHRLQRDDLRRPLQLHRRGRVPLLPAALPHLRADVRSLLHVPRGRGDQLRRKRRHRPGRHAGGPAASDGLGATALREDLRQSAGQRADGVPASEADLRLVAGGGRAVGRGDHRAAAGVSRPSGSSGRWRTGWSSPSSEPGPVGASASSSRAGRRSLPTSRASSTRRVCRSWRDTASPRPRR